MSKYQNVEAVMKDAIQLQDASNWRGVSLTFADMMEYFLRDTKFSDERRADHEAVTKMMVYKIAQLVFKKEAITLYGDDFGEAYDYLKKRLADIEPPKSIADFKARFPRLRIERCEEHIMKALEFAEKRGIASSLLHNFGYLNGYAQERSKGCNLGKDWAPYSFSFAMLDADGKFWFNGGLIYHGEGDNGVGEPTLAVRIGSTNEEWSVHT